MQQTANGTKQEALSHDSIIELIVEIARRLASRTIPDRQAIVIGQEVINDVAKRYRGQPFYFAVTDNCTQRAFMELALTESLHRHGKAPMEAGKISGAVVEDVFTAYKGLSLYVPFGPVTNRKDQIARDKLIIAAYTKKPTTATLKQLSDEHNICIRRIYTIVGKKSLRGRKPVGERNASILTAYTAAPTSETIKRLADEHRLKVGYVYQILWRMKR